ncbi:Acetyltransferase, gnat family [Tenacibaculum litopenaei]|uniref:GNAT family N-acetyltransferase n=1 Tax=Tenacibaculum litopenaei TaxID=396016 RepID=UPI00389432F3
MIRLYTPQDQPQLLALIDRLIPSAFAKEERRDFETYLNEGREDYFVYEHEGKLIGSGGINYLKNAKTARLSWDLVHPDFHGSGIGSQLVQHRIAHVKKAKQYAILEVRTSQVAFQFYQKFGFQTLQITENYWAEGFDLYHMTQAL